MADFSLFEALELGGLHDSIASKVTGRAHINSRPKRTTDSSLKTSPEVSCSQLSKDGIIEDITGPVPASLDGPHRRRRLQGWRFAVTAAACTALAVLLINLVVTIVVANKYHIVNGIGTVYTGDCNVVSNWSTALHVVINVLSSLLLSGSNYTMQCLSSPTRKEIDDAHSKGDWLDIGLPSVRNIMGRIAWDRITLWLILGLSSVPIHLLYNSAVFKSTDSNYYTVSVVSPEFLHVSFSNTCRKDPHHQPWMFDACYDTKGIRSTQSFFFENATDTALVEKLTPIDCINAYGTSFVSGRNDLLLVSNETQHAYPSSLLWYFPSQDQDNSLLPSYRWMCPHHPETCSVQEVRKKADEWTVHGRKIDYCLSRLKPSTCKLEFSVYFLAIVTAMNFCKCACMFWTVFRQKSSTLVTIGDAITSFLDSPEPLTHGRCLMSRGDAAYHATLEWRRKDTRLPNVEPPAVKYPGPQRRRWFMAASGKRWVTCLSLCAIAMLVTGILLRQGASSMHSVAPNASISSLGFGNVDSRAIVGIYGASILGAVLLANLPQVVVSFLYLTYNGLITSMLMSNEWSRYYVLPKPLRTTTRKGVQRSRYYLHLPYTYSIPLIISSMLLHWLISESIFLVQLDKWQYDRLVESTSSLGYSLLPIILALSLGCAMLLIALGLGLRRFRSPMPVAGSCSVAIAAACHRPQDDVDAAYLPISWGEVDTHDGVGHCCFTSFPTTELVKGKSYR